MCDICRMYECPAMCPNAPEEPTRGECSYCTRPIYIDDSAYIMPDDSTYHDRCLINSLDCLEIFDLAEKFGKDKHFDEEVFVKWYENLSEEEIIRELGGVDMEE